MHLSVVSDSRKMFVHLTLALQSDPGLMAMISIAAIGTLAKFVPVIVTGIPGSPGGTDEARVLTVESRGGGVEREVHVDASEQVAQVAFWKMALQSNVDSQPLVGSESLSNLLLVHAEIVVQMEGDEQVAQVVSVVAIALQSNVDSQPLVGSESLSSFQPLQIRAEQTKSAEHDVHVALATDVHETQLSAPLAPNVPEAHAAQVPATVVVAPIKRVAELTTWLPHAV